MMSKKTSPLSVQIGKYLTTIAIDSGKVHFGIQNLICVNMPRSFAVYLTDEDNNDVFLCADHIYAGPGSRLPVMGYQCCSALAT
jgi:hypothetical protein